MILRRWGCPFQKRVCQTFPWHFVTMSAAKKQITLFLHYFYRFVCVLVFWVRSDQEATLCVILTPRAPGWVKLPASTITQRTPMPTPDPLTPSRGSLLFWIPWGPQGKQLLPQRVVFSFVSAEKGRSIRDADLGGGGAQADPDRPEEVAASSSATTEADD